MMVETAVCHACGADIRDESLFCYSCGESLKGKAGEAEPVINEFEDPALRVEDPVRARPESKQPLKSAASLRKQRRAFSRQPVEVTWERPAGMGLGFIITTVVLAAGALALMLIALYLR